MHVNHQCLGMMSEEQQKLESVKGTVKDAVPYYKLFSHIACMELRLESKKCTAEFQNQMQVAAVQYRLKPGQPLPMRLWESHVNNYVMSMMQGGAQQMPPPGKYGRRLSDTDDFGLSALRSASASSALAREDGVLTRRVSGPRRRCTSARACPPRLAWTG